jgi:hypothetical protein
MEKCRLKSFENREFQPLLPGQTIERDSGERFECEMVVFRPVNSLIFSAALVGKESLDHLLSADIGYQRT